MKAELAYAPLSTVFVLGVFGLHLDFDYLFWNDEVSIYNLQFWCPSENRKTVSNKNLLNL